MLTRKRYRHASAVTFVLIALLILFVWLRVVPESWHWTMLLTAVALLLVRITIRLILQRQERLNQASEQPGEE